MVSKRFSRRVSWTRVSRRCLEGPVGERDPPAMESSLFCLPSALKQFRQELLPRISLALCWVRAASGPFLENNFHTPQSGVKNRFLSMSRNGSKVAINAVF